MTHIPVACSLDANAMKTRSDDWRTLLAPNLIERVPIAGGVRMILRNSPEAVAELHRLIALENSCCAWINWTVEEGGHLRVDATTDQNQGTELLEAWFLRTDT